LAIPSHKAIKSGRDASRKSPGTHNLQRTQPPRRPLNRRGAHGSQPAIHFTWEKWGSPMLVESISYLCKNLTGNY